ncbi:MAG: hypothetical protein K2X43_15100 [Hyphomonadaceae bacterium]|nr:hypothetical protein [Hyphomonadaceae bacterium]
MTERQLADGEVAYYWHPNRRDVGAGFTIPCETLGTSYGAAVDRANLLNRMLDDWRTGRKEAPDEGSTRFGSLAWMFADFQETASFKELSERTKPDYRKAMALLTDIETKEGKPAGTYLLKSLTPLAVDKIYAKLRKGKEGQTVFRQANLAVWLAGRAWRVVRRRHPDVFPDENPFEGLERDWKRTPRKAATRSESYALSEALKALGHPHLGLVPLICYEWHQRPENILAGHLRWSDWRPPERPDAVRVEHHKTGEEVWLPLEDEKEEGKDLLFPEIEKYLSELQRLGPAIVMRPKRRVDSRQTKKKEREVVHRLYEFGHARHLVQKARKDAGLDTHITMDACRHGGMTELGDAEATEQEIMSASGHRSPEAARVYVKRTEKQRMAAVRKRRQLRAGKA